MPADEDPNAEPAAEADEQAATPPADTAAAEGPDPADDADADDVDTDAQGAKDGAAKAGSAKGEEAGAEDSADADAGAGKAVGDGKRERRGRLVRAAGVLVLAAAVGTAGLQWYRADQAAREDSARRAVEEQAGEFGQALLSYDHRHLQDARNRVLGLASEDFAKTYDVAFTGGLEGVITKLKADASATVRSVYLGDVDESTARAIVVLDSEVRSSAGTRRVLGSHLDMRLVRKDGRWRVTEVTSIGAAQETMTDPEGRQEGGGGAALPTPGASPSE
ncbi:hypothetical protein ACFHW2_24730 [Actinomadura sp. LOL_016]|uniref:hypothetical protein n=1 Tax=unclassified Actinomadura TaxID=2626254 RepID=UPI003A7FE970